MIIIFATVYLLSEHADITIIDLATEQAATNYIQLQPIQFLLICLQLIQQSLPLNTQQEFQQISFFITNLINAILITILYNDQYKCINCN